MLLPASRESFLAHHQPNRAHFTQELDVHIHFQDNSELDHEHDDKQDTTWQEQWTLS